VHGDKISVKREFRGSENRGRLLNKKCEREKSRICHLKKAKRAIKLTDPNTIVETKTKTEKMAFNVNHGPIRACIGQVQGHGNKTWKVRSQYLRYRKVGCLFKCGSLLEVPVVGKDRAVQGKRHYIVRE